MRPVKKLAKRAASHVLAARYGIRNLVSRQSVVGQTPVVVSLTTYSDRVFSVATALESIGAGTVKPARLILWLDDDLALPPSGLPRNLLRLQRRGLEVLVSENTGPHGKYFGYVTSQQHHEVPLVTADDDIMYPREWLSKLFTAHQSHPDDVLGHWVRTITLADNGSIANYASWKAAGNTIARPNNFAVGVSGVLYPAPMLQELAARGKGFTLHCAKADDIWLHHTALINGRRIRQYSAKPRHFPIIPGTQGKSLKESNVAGGGNDECIKNTYSEGDLQLLAQHPAGTAVN